MEKNITSHQYYIIENHRAKKVVGTFIQFRDLRIGYVNEGESHKLVCLLSGFVLAERDDKESLLHILDSSRWMNEYRRFRRCSAFRHYVQDFKDEIRKELMNIKT